MRCFVWKFILLLSCTLALTPEQGLLLSTSAPSLAQAAEPSNQSPQDGVIKTCTGQRIDLGSPQLTNADLKALTSCSSEVMPQMLEALKSQDWKVKVIAAHTLGLFGTKAKSAIPALSSLIQDGNADIRFAAAQALGEIGTEAVVPALTKALQDKDENVRVSAVTALQQIGSLAQQAKPFLIKALWDGNWYVRSRAASTVSKLGLNEKDIPTLLQAWRDGSHPYSGDFLSLIVVTDSNARNHVWNGSFPAQEVSIFFIKALQNQDPRVRESAAIALGKISHSIPPEAVLIQNAKALIKVAQDKDLKVRQRVIKALEEISFYLQRYFQKPEIPEIQSVVNRGLRDLEADVKLAPTTRIESLNSRKDARIAIRDKEVRYILNYDCRIQRGSDLETSGNGVLELFKGLENENTRLTYTLALDSNLSQQLKDLTSDTHHYSVYRNSSNQEKIAIDQLIFTQQELAINQSMQILSIGDRRYYSLPIFKDILKRKDLDLRRSAIYVLGGIGEGIDIMESTKKPEEGAQVSQQRLQTRNRIIEILMALVQDPNEDQDLRWMAASSLQRMKANMDSYFSNNSLPNPKLVKPIYLDRDPKIPGNTALEFDIYSYQFLYAENNPCGDGLSEIYYALRNILNKPKK